MKHRRYLFALAFVSIGVGVVGACSSEKMPPPLGDGKPTPTNTVVKDASSCADATLADGACATSDAAMDVAPDGPNCFTSDAAAPDGGCGSLPLCGVVTGDYVAQVAPAAMGGMLVDGMYVLTAAHIYTGLGGMTGQGAKQQQTVQISGSTIEFTTNQINAGTIVNDIYSFNVISPDGGNPNSVLDLTLICTTNPNSTMRQQLSYTYSNNTLILMGQGVMGTIANIYTKQ